MNHINKSLALDWRPQRLADLVGQRHVRAILLSVLRSGDIPSAFLFSGPRGTGKTSTARIVAAALTSPDSGGDVDLSSKAAQATLAGLSPDILEIDAASNGTIDDVRDLQQTLLYSTFHGWRVVLLDEAHGMSRPAFDALLKTLEEPPDRTLFILLTTEPSKLPDTVLSRCMPLAFRSISLTDIVSRLQQISKDSPVELLKAIAERSEGGLRDAIMLLQQVLVLGISTTDQLDQLLGMHDFAPSLVSAIESADALTALKVADEALALMDPEVMLDQLSDYMALLFQAEPRTSQSSPFGTLALLQPFWDLRRAKMLGSGSSAFRHAICVSCLIAAKRTGQLQRAQAPETPLNSDALESIFN